MRKLKVFKNVRSYASAFALLAMTASLVLFSGCGDDDDGDENEIELEGTYVISSAVLVGETPQTVPVDYLPPGTEDPMKLPDGTNVQPIFFGLLANAGPCVDDRTKTAIELKANEKVAYVCTDDESLGSETGDWYLIENNETLVIIIETETLPVDVTLTLEDFEISGNTLSGTLNNFQFFPSAENEVTGTQTVTLDVEFTKIN